MMRKSIYWFIALVAGTALAASCSDDEVDFNDETLYPPTISQINSSGTVVVVYGQTYTVSGKMESSVGMRDIYATLVRMEGDKIVEIDKNKRVAFPFDGNPEAVDYNIVVPVDVENASAIKIVGLNTITKTAEELVEIEKTVHKPVISFSRDIDERRVIGQGYPFTVRGSVSNDAKITSLTLIPVVNGAQGSPVTVAIGEDAENFEYRGALTGQSGMEQVIVRAENEYGGYQEEVFNVLSVSGTDFIDFAFTEDLGGFSNILIGEDYTAVAEIFSGSNVVSAAIALKRNGIWESPAPVTLPSSVPDNEYEQVEFPFHGHSDLQAIRITVSNGTLTETVEQEINPTRPARILRDVEMSTDLADNAYFLGLWEPEPVFGRDHGLSNQDRIDWVLTATSSGVQPISPHAYGAGASYYNASLAYLTDFTELTYAFISAVRGGLIKEEVEAITTEYDIEYILRNRIIAGENYNIPGASRRVGPTLNATSAEGGIIIGWGDHTHPNVSPAVVSNVSFAIVWIKKSEQKSNGHWKMTFDVYFPQDNQRVAHNGSNIAPYDPYPLD